VIVAKSGDVAVSKVLWKVGFKFYASCAYQKTLDTVKVVVVQKTKDDNLVGMLQKGSGVSESLPAMGEINVVCVLMLVVETR